MNKKFLNFNKKNKITFNLVKILRLRPKPIAFKLPIAKDFETMVKPSKELSKQPLTVKVLKPNSFLNKKINDSLCKEISLCSLLTFLNPYKIEYS